MLALVLAAGSVRAQPANDACSTATPILTLPFVDAVDVTGATTEPGDPSFDCYGDPIVPNQGTRSVWYTFTASSATSLEVESFGSDYGTTVNVWSGACGGPLVQEACSTEDFDDFYQDEFPEQGRMIVTVGAGETILIEVSDGHNDDLTGSSLVLHVRETPVFRVGDFTATDTKSPSVAAGVTAPSSSSGKTMDLRHESWRSVTTATGWPRGSPYS